MDINQIVNQVLYNPGQPMIFNSGFFLFFFLVLSFFYPFLYSAKKGRTVYLTLFSLYFYYKSSGIYFILLLVTSLIDYCIALLFSRIEIPWKRKLLLVISLVSNLGILFYFKYTNFFFSTLSSITSSNFQFYDIFLPVGISFFTFQSLSYTIDVYRGSLKPLNSYLDFCFFVSFFPQLVAGPIVRASDFIPQISKDINVTKEDIGRGMFLVLTGLFKKAIIADYISVNFVERVFANPLQYSGLENLLGLYGYAIQIYCDFSGYSDIAIGIALMLGFTLIKNFDSPYQSASITEFWRRWHISLSTWLRDYLYIPLGGNRKGRLRTYINLITTMLLGGLWHGADWKFVLWGGLHGTALAVDKLFKLPSLFSKNKLLKIGGVLLTFHFVCFCWIFFRASSLSVAFDMISQILNYFNSQLLPQFIAGYPLVFILLILGYILHFMPEKLTLQISALTNLIPLPLKAGALAIIIWAIMQVKSADIQPFIYFQF